MDNSNHHVAKAETERFDELLALHIEIMSDADTLATLFPSPIDDAEFVRLSDMIKSTDLELKKVRGKQVHDYVGNHESLVVLRNEPLPGYD